LFVSDDRPPLRGGERSNGQKENQKYRPGKPDAGGKRLFPQLELFRDRLVPARVRAMEIIQQAAALADHHEQSTAGTMVLLVLLQVLGEVVDPLREQRDLHVGRTGVLRMQPEILNHLRLNFHIPIDLSFV
jgi:hypothetical protein